MITILLAILIFGLLITVHELGHFIVAKLTGIRVEEFSIGMGPVLVGKKWGETYYSLRAFPIGGFNKMSGMEPGEEADPRGFNRKSVSQRMAVISAGSVMNFLLAIVLFIIIFNVIGIPANTNVIGDVVEGMPAAKAGLKPGDKITAVNGQKTDTWVKLTEIIHKNAGKEIILSVKRDRENFTVPVTPVKDVESGVGLIGIKYSIKRFGFFHSVWLGITKAVGVLKLIIISLVQMIAGQAKAEVAGPVGIVRMIGQVATYGVSSILSFAAVLSLNLGLINLLPIPALDGSRLMFLGIEGIRGKKIDVEKENMVHLIGFALLLTLLIVITYHDILRIFSK